MIALDQHLTEHKKRYYATMAGSLYVKRQLAVFSERSAKTRTKVKRPA